MTQRRSKKAGVVHALQPGEGSRLIHGADGSVAVLADGNSAQRVLEAALRGGASEADVFLVAQLLNIGSAALNELKRARVEVAPLVRDRRRGLEGFHRVNSTAGERRRGDRVYLRRPSTQAEIEEARAAFNDPAFIGNVPKPWERARIIAEGMNRPASTIEKWVGLRAGSK